MRMRLPVIVVTIRTVMGDYVVTGSSGTDVDKSNVTIVQGDKREAAVRDTYGRVKCETLA